MYKFFLVLLMLGSVTLSYAETKIKRIIVNPWISYWATLSMSDVNNLLRSEAETFRTMTPSSFTIFDVTEFRTPNIIGIDIDCDYDIKPNFYLTGRIEYIMTPPGKIDAEREIGINPQDNSTVYARILRTVEVTLVPVMFGVAYIKEVDPVTSVAGKLYLGYAFSNGNAKIESNDAIYPQYNYEVPMQGGGFVSEFVANANLKIAENLFIGLNFGWRIMNIPEMKSINDVPQEKLNKGDSFKDKSGKTIEFDFTGWTYAFNFSYKFDNPFK